MRNICLDEICRDMSAIIGADCCSGEIEPKGKNLYPFFIASKVTVENITKKGGGTDDNGQQNGCAERDNGKAVDDYLIEEIFGRIGSKDARR